MYLNTSGENISATVSLWCRLRNNDPRKTPGRDPYPSNITPAEEKPDDGQIAVDPSGGNANKKPSLPGIK